MPRGHVVSDGVRIATLRGEADLTQWELAKEAGYGLRTIGKIENGQPTGAGTLSAVATVLSRRLKRPITLGDLIRREDGADETVPQTHGLVEEAVQCLDLTQWQPACSPFAESRVVLWDHYRFRELPADLPVLTLQYAPLGQRAEGRCLTPGTRAEWVWPESGDGAVTAGCQLRVRPDPVGPRRGWDLENRVEYVNAFPGRPREWFQAPIAYPTEALTLLVLFPQQRPAAAVRGTCRHGPTGSFVPTRPQPVRSPEGRFAHWHLRAPAPGATYQIEWSW